MSLPIASISSPSALSGRRAYLDGLRGFAALLVYILHHQLWAHEAQAHVFQNAWGYQGEKHVATLPWIRTLFSGGHYAVSVFFVLSGYVLANKPLRIIHQRQKQQQVQPANQEQLLFLQGRLANHLASSLFRRWIRLHLPLIVTTLAYLLSIRALGIHAVPDPQPTLHAELLRWYVEIKNFTFVFRSGGEPWFWYNFHAWSIPIEFRGSVLVFTVLLALSRAGRQARRAGLVLLIYYFLYVVDGWFCALFLAGALLCDLDLQRGRLHAYYGGGDDPGAMNVYSCHAALVVSVYLGGIPSHTSSLDVLRESPGWGRLAAWLKPQAVLDYKWFYLFWAATLLVACLPHIRWLQRFFEIRVNQYLGRVSFALYLVHGPVLWTLGERVYAAVGFRRMAHATHCPGWIDIWPLRKNGPLGLELAFVIPQTLLLPVTLWMAEVVTRLVDEPTVKFASWLEAAWNRFD